MNITFCDRPHSATLDTKLWLEISTESDFGRYDLKQLYQVLRSLDSIHCPEKAELLRALTLVLTQESRAARDPCILKS